MPVSQLSSRKQDQYDYIMIIGTRDTKNAILERDRRSSVFLPIPILQIAGSGMTFFLKFSMEWRLESSDSERQFLG